MTSEILNIINSDPVVFFSKQECPYCDMLEADLEAMHIPFKKVNLDSNNINIRDALLDITKCKTVPQLFIGGIFKGGYKEFTALCGTGKLESLLEPFGIKIDLDF